MSFTVDTEFTPLGAETSEAAVSVHISDGDLRRLHDLATVAGVGGPGAGSFAELLSATLHRGIVESYTSAGLRSSPDSAGADAESATRDRKPADGGSSRRVDARTSRRAALLAAAAATLFLILGTYADHWTWTGFTANVQVWDWMQLLLLPIAIWTFPLWLRFSGEMSPSRRKTLGAAALAFTAFVLAGYLVPLNWTGFRGHTLWNWLTLIVLPLTITAVAAWPKTGRRFRLVHAAAAAAVGVAWIVTVVGGYAGHWAWTGYPDNTLSDCLKLFLARPHDSVAEYISVVRIAATPVVDSACQTASRPAT